MAERTNMNIYGLYRRRSCDTTIINFGTADSGYKVLEDLKYDVVARSRVEGYIEKGKMVLVPYNGRYGRGLIACTHAINPYNGKSSSKYMDIAYYVEKED